MKHLYLSLIALLFFSCAEDEKESNTNTEDEYTGPTFSYMNERDFHQGLILITDLEGELLDSASFKNLGETILKIDEENQIVSVTIMTESIVSYHDVGLSELKYWWDNSTSFSNGAVTFNSELPFQSETKNSLILASEVDFAISSALNLNGAEVYLGDKKTLLATWSETNTVPEYSYYDELERDQLITLLEDDFMEMDFQSVLIDSEVAAEQLSAKLYGYDDTSDIFNIGNDLINMDVTSQQGVYYTGDLFTKYSSKFAYKIGSVGYINYYPESIPSTVEPLIVEDIKLNNGLSEFSMSANGSFQLIYTRFMTSDFSFTWDIYGKKNTEYHNDLLIEIANKYYSEGEIDELEWSFSTFVEKDGISYDKQIDRISYPLENGAWEETKSRELTIYSQD